MGKNTNFKKYMNTLAKINHNDKVQEAAEKDTVQIYSAMAISLYNLLEGTHDEKIDNINQIFVESQRVWSDCVENGDDILKECEKLTGINLKYEG